jgi:hypothetical protein
MERSGNTSCSSTTPARQDKPCEVSTQSRYRRKETRLHPHGSGALDILRGIINEQDILSGQTRLHQHCRKQCRAGLQRPELIGEQERVEAAMYLGEQFG